MKCGHLTQFITITKDCVPAAVLLSVDAFESIKQTIFWAVTTADSRRHRASRAGDLCRSYVQRGRDSRRVWRSEAARLVTLQSGHTVGKMPETR
ncbi:type II toxin-antitoxin system prevent-host-death family antitoxin [uncultured Mycobacterium sp.]|uniref:type II toxin-antitoxin system prevent-host-death family antitoxin n=1 Tax=uncultured Mycobacterium sp. TaxID=171292 RepID=UPI0035CB91DC